MTTRRRQARPLVHEGPRGQCSCCDKKTEIKIGSTHGKPKTVSWVVSPELMEQMYSAIGGLIKTKKTKDDREKLYVLDPGEFKRGRAVTRNKLYFVEGEEGVIAGPFGPVNLKVFFNQNQQDDHTIYVVSTTHRSLSIIQASPLIHEAQEEEPEDAYEGDLF
jgi:hypothetical protein